MSTYENRPYTHAHDYTSFAGGDIDLMSDAGGPPSATGGPRYQPARRLEVLAVGSGTLAIRFGSGGSETFTITAGEIGTSAAVFEAHHITTILSATNVGRVRVSW